MSTSEHFVLADEWLLNAPTARVYAVLADPSRYPTWWPQVRSAVPLDADRGHATVRALLPYTMHLTVTRESVDPDAGLLRARLSGDLDGWCSWRVTPSASGFTRARFDQQVRVTPWVMRLWARWARDLALANHRAMMRGGERGLEAYLAGRR
ncbi:MAG: SRPBCC family protein [Dermatophilaceae bacterium]